MVHCSWALALQALHKAVTEAIAGPRAAAELSCAAAAGRAPAVRAAVHAQLHYFGDFCESIEATLIRTWSNVCVLT